MNQYCNKNKNSEEEAKKKEQSIFFELQKLQESTYVIARILKM